MKTKSCWAAFLLSLIAINAVLAAPLHSVQARAIKMLYARQDKALLSKNINALIAQTDINFQRKEAGRIRTGRAAEREYSGTIFQHVKSFDAVRTTIKSSDFVSHKMVVVAQTRFSGLFRNAPQDKWEHRAFTTTTRDTWVSTSSGWKLRLTEDLP